MTICSVLLVAAVMTGCAHASAIKDSGENRAVQESTKSIENKTKEPVQEIALDHLKINVSGNWEVKKGLDSAAFSIKGNPIGIIEGLAYSDSVEALVPNQSVITDKQKLDQLPFEAYQVTVVSDAVQSETKKETHIFLFLESKKAVYDLRFEASAVDEQTLLQIVHSAVME